MAGEEPGFSPGALIRSLLSYGSTGNGQGTLLRASSLSFPDPEGDHRSLVDDQHKRDGVGREGSILVTLTLGQNPRRPEQIDADLLRWLRSRYFGPGSRFTWSFQHPRCWLVPR